MMAPFKFGPIQLFRHAWRRAQSGLAYTIQRLIHSLVIVAMTLAAPATVKKYYYK